MEMMPGMKTPVREVLKMTDKDHMMMEWYETHGGQEKKTMEIAYTRAGKIAGGRTRPPGAPTLTAQAAVSAADLQVGRPLLWAPHFRRAEDCPPYRRRFLGSARHGYEKAVVLALERH